MALALKGLGQYKEAARYFERALKLNPTFEPARIGIVRVCTALGDEAHKSHRREEALLWYRRCLQWDMNNAFCHNNMAIILQEMGRIDEGLDHYRKALVTSAHIPFIHSNYLLGLHYSPKTTQSEYYIAATGYGKDKPQDLHPVFMKAWTKDRPFRLGYISGDFSGHAVSTFILPLLEVHDPLQAQTMLFSNSPLSSRVSQWLNGLGMPVHYFHQSNDDETLDLIRGEKLDILIDLSGHSARNRLPVLSRRAAPVQATWLGYFNTTGVAAMDYLIADERCCPQGSDQWHTEKIMRLPHSFLCYTPPEVEPSREQPPCLSARPFIFGCFNETPKLNEELIKTWAVILHQAKGARLMLKAKGFADASVVRRYASLFASLGISPQRLIMQGPSDRATYLAAYRKVDLCLDPFPYNGGTVTCDALCMGVPVLTLAGEMMVGRMGLSLLHAAGFAEWVCFSREDYIQRAIHLAANPEALAQMRTGLRQKMLSSPLCDRQLFVNDLMHACRAMLDLA